MFAIGTRWAGVWRREPLLSFAIGGGVLYLLLAPLIVWGRAVIRIDARTATAIIERRSNALGRELAKEETERAIHDYVREEILVREAYRRGWHRQNRRVRQRLLLAMRTALSEDPPPPSTDQLRAYFEANAERYRTPVSVSFAHVFFEEGSSRFPGDVSHFVGSLEHDTDYREIGDPHWLGSTVVRQTLQQLRGSLGSSFAEAVFALEPGSWAGPIESTQGVHFVRVDARHPSELPALAAVERFVEVDWKVERREEVHDRNMSRLRARYRILEP